MWRAPEFWERDGILPRLLSPLAAMSAAATARRVARPGWRAPVPVICCGNVSVGGSGKTTLALDLGQQLTRRNIALHYLLRGYGRRSGGVLRVTPEHAAAAVGDEALLLAELAPTWVAGDRAAAARAAVAAGAAALVMDDGLQNPGLCKDLSLLVIDGGAGFGNGRVLPAGPLREPIAAGAARCRAAVLIGADRTGAASALPASLPVLRARLEAGPATRLLAGRKVMAFAGIARPAKFFTTLEEAGADLRDRVAFPDHHRYSKPELGRLLHRAEGQGAIAVTTAKDAARLPWAIRKRVHVADVVLVWDDQAAIGRLLDTVLNAAAGFSGDLARPPARGSSDAASPAS